MPKLVYTETRSLAGWRKRHDVLRFYWWWWVNYLYMKIMFRLAVKGAENIPTSGSGLLISNHLSLLDANIISAASPRKVSFMIAREWYQSPLLKWLCDFLGCIPVNRSGQDLSAIKSALRHLAGNFLVGCFPEGGISKSGEMQEGKLGVALLAIRSGRPVIPVRLSGHHCQSLVATFLLPKRISIEIGKPIIFEGLDYKNKEHLQEATDVMSESIRNLGGNG